MKVIYCILMLFFALSCCSSPTMNQAGDVCLSGIEQLPEGNAPAPELVPHFPDRLHTFVWRNWNLVRLEKLAQVLKTSPSNI